MKQILLALCCCIATINVFSQTSLWKVSKDGKELFLGGTVHILRPSDYPLPKEYDSAFSLSQKLVFEADIEKLEDPQIATTLMMKSMLPDNKTLKDVLSKEVYDKLEAEAASMSIPIAPFARMKPSLVIITLSAYKMQLLGISSDGIDKHMFVKAKDAGKELAFLETVDEQLDMLVHMGEGKEDEFVLYSLEDFDSMETQLDSLTATWRNGDSKPMEEELTEMKADFPDIYNTLLVERNNNWVPKIESFLSDDTVEFVLVGSLHMHGEDGLLNLLKERGCDVEQFVGEN